MSLHFAAVLALLEEEVKPEKTCSCGNISICKSECLVKIKENVLSEEVVLFPCLSFN